MSHIAGVLANAEKSYRQFDKEAHTAGYGKSVAEAMQARYYYAEKARVLKAAMQDGRVLSFVAELCGEVNRLGHATLTLRSRFQMGDPAPDVDVIVKWRNQTSMVVTSVSLLPAIQGAIWDEQAKPLAARLGIAQLVGTILKADPDSTIHLSEAEAAPNFWNRYTTIQADINGREIRLLTAQEVSRHHDSGHQLKVACSVLQGPETNAFLFAKSFAVHTSNRSGRDNTMGDFVNYLGSINTLPGPKNRASVREWRLRTTP